VLAEQRARKREALLVATETALAPIATAMAEGQLAGADRIGLKVGKVIDRYKMAEHFDVAITDTSLAITRADQITAEATLDGIDVLCNYLTWHLRAALAELTHTDEAPPARDNPHRPRHPIRSRPTQGRPAHRRHRRVAAQLPRPARPHSHPDPQHHHPWPHQLRQDQHADPDSTPRIRTDQRADPADPEIARAQSLVGASFANANATRPATVDQPLSEVTGVFPD